MSTTEKPGIVARQQSSTERSELVASFVVPARHGEHVIEIPPDADIFAVVEEAGMPDDKPGLRLFATVTVWDHKTSVNLAEPRTIWIARTHGLLPSARYRREAYEKQYVGTVVVRAEALHVWSFRRK